MTNYMLYYTNNYKELYYMILHELYQCITWKASKTLHVSLNGILSLITSNITWNFYMAYTEISQYL
jgi:hypothetical protein